MGHSERRARGEVSSKPALDWPWAWAPAEMDSALPSGLLRPMAGRVGRGRAPGVWDLGRPLREAVCGMWQVDWRRGGTAGTDAGV